MAEYIVPVEDIGVDGAYFGYAELIRCKDCKRHGTNGDRLNCAVFCCTMPDDGFCSGGERRDND